MWLKDFFRPRSTATIMCRERPLALLLVLFLYLSPAFLVVEGSKSSFDNFSLISLEEDASASDDYAESFAFYQDSSDEAGYTTAPSTASTSVDSGTFNPSLLSFLLQGRGNVSGNEIQPATMEATFTASSASRKLSPLKKKSRDRPQKEEHERSFGDHRHKRRKLTSSSSNSHTLRATISKRSFVSSGFSFNLPRTAPLTDSSISSPGMRRSVAYRDLTNIDALSSMMAGSLAIEDSQRSIQSSL